MDIVLLLKSAMGLIVLLAALIFLLFYSPSAKAKKIKKKPSQEESSQKKDIPKIATDLDSLRKIIKNKKSSAKELKTALDAVLKYHGNIHKKLGIRTHPEFDVYMDILFTICRHPSTNKNIIIGFDKELAKLNPEYKSDINDAITKGLNSRGI